MTARRRLFAVTAAGLLGLSGLAGCSPGSGSATGGTTTLRLGYFPNVTHAVPLVGIGTGRYAKALGSGTTLEPTSFNAGPDAVTALLSGSIDAAYVGPNPTVNAWAQSHGSAVEVIAGAASGGAALVVDKKITSWSDLKGADIATPQLGNTQDVSARYFLAKHGLSTTKSGGGDVHIKPMANGDAVTAYKSGAIDGAWIPEPYASQIAGAGGHVLVDERSLWPGGTFVVTDLLVRKDFAKAHPDVVTRLLRGQVQTVDYLKKQPAAAQRVVSQQIGTVSGKPLDLALVRQAWPKIEFTNDPLATTLIAGAKHAESVDLLDPVDLDGIYQLDPLNEVLKAAGEPTVSAGTP
ncbi:ABC transporter substrate-binding protein [Actinocatenispora sera]|uniref:Lipoprotein n=1 Tax=Actinocatenispora sera TaxID=390989 RepID=A0A810KZ30_9ACTN|nr:ABC transporter substrate-binding protein [Actinocatenispora sera]BCJ27481.1 lipoprotein [Actinocatenispora sera]